MRPYLVQPYLHAAKLCQLVEAVLQRSDVQEAQSAILPAAAQQVQDSFVKPWTC